MRAERISATSERSDTGSTNGGPDWGLGRYEATAVQLLPAAALTVERTAPAPGERVLDVGCGTGNAALLAAARGALVTGVDPSARLIDVARQRSEEQGVDATFVTGVAEALPVTDGCADLVLSVFGVIFTPDPQAAASEIARVTTDTGWVVLTAWLPEGAVVEIARTSQEAVFGALRAEPPRSFAWHEHDSLVRLFGPHGFSVELEEATVVHRAASIDEYVAHVLDVHPLAVAGRSVLEPLGEAGRLARRTRAILENANEDANGFAVTSRYVVATLKRC